MVSVEPVAHETDQVDGHAKAEESVAKENDEDSIVACLGVIVNDGRRFCIISNDIQSKGFIKGRRLGLDTLSPTILVGVDGVILFCPLHEVPSPYRSHDIIQFRFYDMDHSKAVKVRDSFLFLQEKSGYVGPAS